MIDLPIKGSITVYGHKGGSGVVIIKKKKKKKNLIPSNLNAGHLPKLPKL